MEKYQGKYYRTLIKTQITMTLIIALLLVSFSIALMFFQDFQTIQNNKMTVYSYLSTIDTFEAIITKSVWLIANSTDLNRLLDSSKNNEFYEASLKLKNQIATASSQLGLLSYSFSVIDLQHDGFCITPVGTCDVNWFFAHETNLTEAERKMIDSALNTNNFYYLPRYNVQGEIDEIYSFSKYESLSGNKAIIVTIVDASKFYKINNNAFGYLLNNQGLIIADQKSEDANRALLTYKEDSNSNKVFYNKLTNSNWGYLVVFKSSFWPLIILISINVVVISVITLCFYILGHRKANKLYNPISQLLRLENAEEFENENNVDEFEILKKNGLRIQELSKQLTEAINQKNVLATIRYNRKLLEGALKTEDKADKGTYCVARLLSLETDDTLSVAQIPYLQLFLDSRTRDNNTINYVAYGTKQVVLILAVNSILEAKELLRRLLKDINPEIQLAIALSDLVNGKIEIAKANRQTEELIDYRLRYPGLEFLTSECLLNAKDLYYYPASVERQVINYVKSGNEQGLVLLNELIKENRYNLKLTKLAYLNFVHALIITLERVFQECRLLPNELLSYSISWEELYKKANEDEVADTLMKYFEDITKALHLQTTESNEIVLEKMKNYIHKNYMWDIMLQDLADKFNLTPKYCGMLFSQLSNDTFKNYLNSYRIEMAKIEIQKNPSIKILDLSDMVGFNSSTSFIRVFGKYTGLSPKNYADEVAMKKY